MATYVLVHGGSHGGWCYQKVARILQAKGHIVYTPTLTGLADREHLLSADVDLETHITDVVKLLHFEDLGGVILVGHSYGGMVITGVADRAYNRVGHRVYLDAAYPRNGESLTEHAGPMMLESRKTSRVIAGVELVNFPGTGPQPYYGVTDPELIAWMHERLTPHPWKSFDQKLVLRNEKQMRAIPESHIICTATIPGRDMENLNKHSHGRVWDVDTGHDLMLTEPEKTAELLLRIA